MRIESMINSIITLADNPMSICFDELIIEQDFPLHMEKLPVTICEKAVSKGIFPHILCYKILECIGELCFILVHGYTALQLN